MKAISGTRLHQTLHGYQNGHQLLASSCELNADSRAALLVLSDMSGPSMVPGFESYLTGVPLVSEQLYALSRTWYAPEMPRPGCVWTHTLLVRFSDLAHIENLYRLQGSFRRPLGGDVKSFGHPVVFENSMDEESRDWAGESAYELLAVFYSTNRAVILPAPTASEWERQVLWLWSQQGSVMRREFSFCTGAIADRKFQGKSLALQVVPLETARQVRRDNPTSVVFDTKSQLDVPNWVPRFLNEKGVGGALSQIGFGIADRELIPRVLELWSETNDQDEAVFSALLEIVAFKYPSPNEGRDVKSALFGRTRAAWDVPTFHISEQYLLGAICRTQFSSAYDAAVLELRERGRNLWGQDRAAAQHMALGLLRGDGNELGEEVLAGLMDGAPATELWDLVQRNTGLVVALVRRNPSLAESPKIWCLPRIEARDVLGAIGHQDSAANVRTEKVVAAVLDAERFDLSVDLVARYGKEAVSSIISWVDRQEEEPMPDAWILVSQALRRRQEVVLEHLRDHSPDPRVAAFLVAGLDPEHVDQLPSNAWRVLAQRDLPQMSATFRRTVNAVFLVVGLRLGAPGEELVTKSFPMIHAVLAKDELEYEYWSLLDSLLPQLGMWRNWDKCERLRRAFAQHATKYDWSIASVLKATREDELFDQFVSTCRRMDSEWSLLIRASKESRRLSESITKHQRQVLLDIRHEKDAEFDWK